MTRTVKIPLGADDKARRSRHNPAMPLPLPIVPVLGLARHWPPRDTPLLRRLSEALFPLYLLHQPLLAVIATPG